MREAYLKCTVVSVVRSGQKFSMQVVVHVEK